MDEHWRLKISTSTSKEWPKWPKHLSTGLLGAINNTLGMLGNYYVERSRVYLLIYVPGLSRVLYFTLLLMESHLVKFGFLVIIPNQRWSHTKSPRRGSRADVSADGLAGAFPGSGKAAWGERRRDERSRFRGERRREERSRFRQWYDDVHDNRNKD